MVTLRHFNGNITAFDGMWHFDDELLHFDGIMIALH